MPVFSARWPRHYFLCLLFVVVQSLQAADFSDYFFDPQDGAFDVSAWLSDNAYGFLPVPIIVTEPAVGNGGGMMGLFFHESDQERDQRIEAAKSSEQAAHHLLPPSVTAVGGLKTSNDTWVGALAHMGFWHQGRIRYLGYAGYGSINLDFYGSEDLPFNRALELNTEGTFVGQTLKFKVADSRLFAGVKHGYFEAEISPTNLDDILDELLPPSVPPEVDDQLKELLTIETTNSGAGVVLEYDHRDNVFSPQHGYTFELEYMLYREGLGGDFHYDQLTMEGQGFWPLSEQFSVATRVGSDYVYEQGLLPPYAYPAIGMRGISAMRYQGKRLVEAEIEGRWNVTPRWQLSVFAGGGRVAESSGELSEAASQVARGVGFRYMMARRYGFMMGVDIAQGPDETAWYIQAGSAW